MKLIKLIIDGVKDFFGKRVTKKYPFGEPDIQEEYRGEHIYDEDKCSYTLACAKNCPVAAIKVNPEEGEWEVDLGKCIFCGRCEEVCPENAISFSNNFDMMSKEREGLKSDGYSD